MASLELAVAEGMLDRLQPLGFRLAECNESNRGSSVRLTNDRSVIEVAADWLEGEIEVTAGTIGGTQRPLRELVPSDAAHGLHLSRLARGVGTAVVGSQLDQVAALLMRHQPDLFARP